MIVNTNLLADTMLIELSKHHSRVYRNGPPQKPVPPYVVFVLDNNLDTDPSEDYYIHVDIFDEENKSVRAMEDLADTIDNDINDKVINLDNINLHFKRENRQFIDNKELGGKKLITIRYNTRVYFK